jgi:hypothetical protein
LITVFVVSARAGSGALELGASSRIMTAIFARLHVRNRMELAASATAMGFAPQRAPGGPEPSAR